MRVVWTLAAAADLDQISDYLFEQSAKSLQRLFDASMIQPQN
jgi:plasmid stabilization system protein ParE